jgi:hypothetical protein
VRYGRIEQLDEFDAFINSLNFEGAGPILSTTGGTPWCLRERRFPGIQQSSRNIYQMWE